MILTRNLQALGENSVPVPLFPPQTPHRHVWDRNHGDWTLDTEIPIGGAKCYLLLDLNAEYLKKC
jgi:hypothetical protein